MKILSSLLMVLGLGFLTGCSSVKVTDQQTYSMPDSRPKVIYVANFDLQTANIHSEPGLLGIQLRPLRPVHELLTGEDPDNPDAVAIKLVNRMADSIVHDLKKVGFPAERIDPEAAIPTDGWLVRGVFAQVDEGNQLRRALIGFGLGKTDLQVVVSADNLADGPPKPLYEIKTEATSGNGPGAGALIAINPALVAVHYVMAGGDLKRNVRKTAAKIASQTTEQFQPKK